MLLEHPEVNLEHARRTHHEYYAPALVNNWWLRLFCAGLVLALLVFGLGGLRTSRQLAKQRVIVLEVGRDGSFDQLQYVNMSDYKPDDKVVEHFAYVWAVKYYSRVRSTIAEDYPASLKFFAPDLVTEFTAEAERSRWVQDFLDSSGPEIRVVVKKIRLEKGTITIDFDKHFYLSGRETTAAPENWTTQIRYQRMPLKEITNGMIPLNPVGLKITDRPLETKGF
jgi:hypothetical protein